MMGYDMSLSANSCSVDVDTDIDAAVDAEAPYPAQACARVCLVGDQSYVVMAGTQRLRAVRAASCLLTPEAGDTVAWWHAGDGEGYILAVLTRANEGPQRLLFDGDAEIGSRGGSLSLHADEAVTVRGERLNVDADELSLHARLARGVVDTLETFGRSVVSTVSRWKVVGTELSTVFERVFQHARQSRRVTEDVDHVSAGMLDMHGKQVLNMQAENLMASGSRLIKMQGKQIHLG